MDSGYTHQVVKEGGCIVFLFVFSLGSAVLCLSRHFCLSFVLPSFSHHRASEHESVVAMLFDLCKYDYSSVVMHSLGIIDRIYSSYEDVFSLAIPTQVCRLRCCVVLYVVLCRVLCCVVCCVMPCVVLYCIVLYCVVFTVRIS
jgi:hypothetical protein